LNVLGQAEQINSILSRSPWAETVAFYTETLGLPVTFQSSWFVEFALSETARVSVADASRTTVKCAAGEGLTLSLQVKDPAAVWSRLKTTGITPTAIIDHPMQARVFYFFDPEGYRIEIWSPKS